MDFSSSLAGETRPGVGSGGSRQTLKTAPQSFGMRMPPSTRIVSPFIIYHVRRAMGISVRTSTRILGKTMRDVVRNKVRWKRRRAPTQDPSTS